MKIKLSLVLMLLLLSSYDINAAELIPEECQWAFFGDTETIDLVATGPYYEQTNVVVVVYLPHPETISKITFSNGFILEHPILKEYEIFLGNQNAVGSHIVTADVEGGSGRVRRVTTEFTVFPSNRYIRGVGSNPNYLSSIISVDEERGDLLDRIQDFSSVYGDKYPWFLRITSEVNASCQHLVDPALYPWPSPTKSLFYVANFLPVLNHQVVGGEPPMMAFGSSAKNGTPLFINQDYHFGVIAGRPASLGALKIEVYEKSDFENGNTSVAPVFVQTNSLPNITVPEQLETLRNQFYTQDYHLTNNIHGKAIDFDTKVEYQFGSWDQTWGIGGFVIPLLITHRSANDLFYYKVSFKGDAPVLNDPTLGISMAFQVDEHGQHEAYNLTYALDFTQPDSWRTLFINQPHFQNKVGPSPYVGKSLEELLHHTAIVQDTLASPDALQWQRLTELNKTPELKTHPLLDQLVDDLNRDPLHIANYVQNNIELTDAIGLSQTNGPISINPQGVMRDALATYLEGQGSPTEQCALLIYLLRKAGIPAGYVFPAHDATLMFDQQLSVMLHMQIRGAESLVGQLAGIPELIPVNYPWVVAYIDGKWKHLFPWIKDTEVKEGKDIWNYFPDGYKDARQWVCHYLSGDSSIRSLSKEDNVGTLFPLYAEKYLSKKHLTLDDVGIRFKNRKDHQYQDWDEFPRPWQTPTISDSDLVNHLSNDFFDTISIQVFSDRNHNGELDLEEPVLETGEMRFADLHDRRLLLYHQLIPSTNPASPQYQMILSLEPYDSTPGNHDGETIRTFFKNGAPDIDEVRAGQKISTILCTATTSDDPNDDALCYKIVRHHHQQAVATKQNNFTQFPVLLENINDIIDKRPLRKGDMAVLSLYYGRVTEEMKNFELKKYLDYQRFIHEHPGEKVDPEIATGQLLQLMGMTYYYHVSQFQERIEAWTKTHTVSYRAHGLTKFSPEYGTYGPVTNINNGSLDFSLCYPKVDMSFQRAVMVGNQTVHLESGANTGAGIQSGQLLSAETSAQEHHIINEFFNQADAISTVKLLDVAREKGKKNLVLRQDNYEEEKYRSLVSYQAKNGLNGFITLWNNIENFFQNNKNDPFATVFLTPEPVTAEKQQGIPYTGMGAFSISSTSCSAWITDRMYVANGGFGEKISLPINSQNPDMSDVMLVQTEFGGISLFQGPFTKNSNFDIIYISPQISLDHFQNANQQVAAGNQALTPDVIEHLCIWNSTVHQADEYVISPTFNTGIQAADLWKKEVDRGNLGTVSYYKSSLQAVRQGIGKLVHDPVNVITGEFYINALDLELKGPMPLELRRVYGSQNGVNSNFGYGWKLGYFPYLLLSEDGNATTLPSLIYAAEPDGSVIAYRYQAENKNWIPLLADNPEMVNNNDGRHLVSVNHFNNKIFKVDEKTYQLDSCDGSVRTFVIDSFPIAGSADIKRERPYLQHWSDASGNYYDFQFGKNKNNNDYGELNRISSSNGNSLRFRYDPYGHIIEVFSSDGRWVKYNYDVYGDLISAVLTDGSKISYQYQHANDGNDDKKVYSTHLITQVTKPDGRMIQNDYDAQRRVTIQRTTTGLSPKPKIAAQFQYDLHQNNKNISGKTTVTDAAKHQTVYEMAQSRIIAVHFPENRSITQTWSAGALASQIDQRGLATTFDYDARGNLISQTVSGNLTGHNHAVEKATTQFSYNGKNFLTAVIDQLRCGINYAYDDLAHPASPTCITKIIDGKVVNTTHFSYQNVGGAYGLLVGSDVDGAVTSYDYDKHGFLAAMTQKTGAADPDIVTRYTSNQRGEIVAISMADGSHKKYFYDALGHPTGVETDDAKGGLIDWHFNYYNQNGELEWAQGARFNPVDYTYYDYDRAGNLLHQIFCLSAGLAVTTYQYDQVGNCTSVTDPNGNVTRMSYDGLGEMLSRQLSDGSEEHFTYEAGGKMATHQTLLGGTESYTYTSTGLLQSALQADGTLIQYCYDLDGRLVEGVFSNGLRCQIAYQGDVVTSTFSHSGKNLGSIVKTYDSRGNLIAKTDLMGSQWSYSYDDLNRIKSVQGPAASACASQQTMTYSYQPGFLSTVNALGEVTHQYSDALGRPVLTTLFNKDGSVAQNIDNQYSGDHQSVTTTIGTGANEMMTTTFTDAANHVLMVQNADGSFQQCEYDLNGNLISLTDEEGNKTSYTYDVLNHLASEQRADGSILKYRYNPLGELLMRSMPQGLVEKNNYNNAGEKISSSLVGSDGAITRYYSYEYNQGLITSVNDPRGGKFSIEYDAWMHPVTVAASGFSIPEQNQITAYSYDLRGLLTAVAQQYENFSTGSSTLVSRTYDAYGQLASEITSLNGTNIAAWNQTWDGAGRRSSLKWTADERGKEAQYQFSYNALGLMTRVENASATASYVYGDHGLLMSQHTPAGQKNLQRDHQGRITQLTLPDGSQETLSWRSDGKMKSYSIVGSANETRNYAYDLLGHLTEEPYTLTYSSDPNTLSLGTHTATYSFDQLGVRLKQEVTTEVQNVVSEKNNFSQVVGDDFNTDVNKTYLWTSVYDTTGAVAVRDLKGEIIQELTWDSMGRLTGINQHNKNDQGYNWKTTYDGLGRRIQTSYCDVTGNQTTSQPLTMSYFYDPEIEFLELGRDYFGRTWNLYGPDRSGFYGGAQGIGGLEATTEEGHHEINGIVNNVFGDSIGITTGGIFHPWENVLGGYGAMPGASVNTDLVPQWRDHYLDWTGFYYMGTRYYEPKTGRFLSPDPLGHDVGLDLYAYCNGDPVNGLDPDGRCVEKGNNARVNVSYSWDRAMGEPDATIGKRILAGIPVSILSGDAFTQYKTPEDRMNKYGFMPSAFSANGIWSGDANSQKMRLAVAQGLNLNEEVVYPIQNPSYGPLDLIRAGGQQAGAIDITALRAADMINASGGGIVVVHSNGSAVFYAASALLKPEVKANIGYQGYGPQIYINTNNVSGLRSTYNVKESDDIVPLIFNRKKNTIWDRIIIKPSVLPPGWHPLDSHDFMKGYYFDVHPR